ncbi:signal recognition particle receptor subunit alpha (SRPRA) [Vairimorpha necatrix]|uniref:Signal recognition particle receptor subunit alpha homolog n=1 Tax=Vairimorpha necatrix TaxID=6039 RepID=A0AAX4JDZ3_9MICR
MSYFVIFNTRGNILFEEGLQPNFLKNVILSIDTNSLVGTKTVRDEKVEYEIRGNIVYMSVGHTQQIHDLINKQKETKEVEKKEIETEEQKLNYSTTSVIKQKIIETVSKKTFKKGFNLFTNKIHIEELKDKMELHLVKKNVDYDTTKILTECVINQFKDENIEYVTPDIFKKYVSNVLQKLIPSVDHEKFLKKIKNKDTPFSICFVGVNGVGKSTSLAKICYWLLENDLKVYIAACDTFRAGAVEQLKVHVDRFRGSGHNVGFYEKGYGKDDASVARTAVQIATNEKYDVILIDTAGRMHNKSTLMDSLSKLIKVNVPDYIVYVGEALVGADSLDHIREFNKFIEKGNANRKIDSIILTKVDTVDDKIGQILNMTFSSHAPVLFLGTGQTNNDLMKIDSDDIVQSLLS